MKNILASWLFFSVAASSVQAQALADSVRVTSLQQVLATAMQHNPTQVVYQEQVRQATYTYRASKGYLYPNAAASFAGTDNLRLATTPVPGELIGQPGTTYYAQFGRRYNYTSGLTLSQSIFDWTAILQTRLARTSLQLTQLQQASYEQGLKEQVARLYFSALIAQTALRINQTDQHLADTLQTLAQQRLREGTTDLLATNQATINHQNVQQSRAQSQQLLDQSLENLKILLGTQPTTELRLTESLRLDSLRVDPSRAGSPAPGLQVDRGLAVYEQQAAIATLQGLAQRAIAYPIIAASAFLGGQQFRTDFGFSLNGTSWNPYRYIGLTINVPLFTGFTNSNKNKSAGVQQHIAQLQFDNARRESAINDRLLLKNYADYRQLVASSATSFRLYGDNLRLTQQKYREGLLAMDAYLRVFQDYLTAENAYLNNLSLLFATRATILARQ